MPPDASPSKARSADWAEQAAISALPKVWRAPLSALGLAALFLMALTAREWGEMFHQWWNIDTYTHILLVPFIVGWLVWLKLEPLMTMVPRASALGLALVMAGLGLWLLGRGTGINLIAQAGAVGAVQGAVVAVLGIRISWLLALPLAYLTFLVPFGDEIIPFLQSITAEMAIALTLFSGVPAQIDGIYIDTPAGLFIVAEECSGVKFLIAMVTLATLIAFTRFESWSRRAILMVAAIIIPILANGVRAWGTIFIAQFAGVEFAEGFDHVIYGWVFFAIVVALILAGAWRFFEKEPEDYGYSAEQVARQSWINRLEALRVSPAVAMAAIVAFTLIAVVFVSTIAPAALG
ncbi:MAG: exosortase A [Pseudomonadota bacterium]